MKDRADQKSFFNKAKLSVKKEKLINRGDVVFVALSGGADSVALAEFLIEYKKISDFELKACHFNHKIRGEEGDADQKFVEKYCREKHIPLKVGERTAGEVIKNEENARDLRYKFFDGILAQEGSRQGKIALAHHMDDVAETFLMRMIRGSGLKGLSSILPRRKNFIRPLLGISKMEIIDYLKTHHQPYCTDATNFSDIYFRNKVRNTLIPLLAKFNPQITKKLAETAEVSAELYQYIAMRVAEIFERITEQRADGYIIHSREFAKLAPAEQTYLVIMCIDKLGGKDYTFAQVKNIVQLVTNKTGKKELPLPHSLRFSLKSGKIYLYKTNR